MRLGQRVMLICKDDFMPPIGAEGFIASALDEYGDYLVNFPDFPCPVQEIEWDVPSQWLIPINPPPATTQRKQSALPA